MKKEKEAHSEVHSSGLLTRLGLFTAMLIVVSSMIGSGIFKKLRQCRWICSRAGLLLLVWLIAGVITFIGAVTNAEIAGLIAAPGGQYVYFKEMYGKAFAFLYGWSCFSVIQSASIASIAYVFAESVNAVLPLPHFGPDLESLSIFGIFYPLDSFGVKALTIITIIFLTTANYLGVIFFEDSSAIYSLL
ncbi:MAG: amino acid permease [Ignavibacteria bacterium]|nr:amino acid permease [Ignavibacteria bacterium]